MAHLSIHLLGPLQVTLDGEPVTAFESDKARALLAYLAVEHQAPQRREKLAGLLWPDWPETSARTNLRRALANLRKALGDHQATPPFLHISHHTIQFNRASDAWVDVVAFCEILKSLPQSTNLPDASPQTIHHLEEAAVLYRGAFLEGFSLADSPAFEEWVLFEQERLQRLVMEALHYLSDWYERQGETEHALQHAWRQVTLDPLRESAHRQIMRLLARSGQRGAALAQYESCRRVLAEELDVEPGAETTALYERIRDEAQSYAPSPTPRHNLPAPLTPFVGRKAELAQIRDRLQDPACRLLTLVGPGGIGKTRLALEAATTEVEGYAHGVFQVRLAGVNSVEAIVPNVAKAIGFSFYEGENPQQQLLNYLQRKTMLLIIDNFEHLLDGVNVVTDILRASPGVTILVTSRTRLNLKGEHLFPVSGLTFPELESLEVSADFLRQAQDLAQYDAVRLLLTGARRVRPGFELEGHERGVVRICRLMQGMPLAILLAAAWVEMLSPAEIADQLAQSMDILETGWQDIPERQRSMRAVFDHSWQLLTEHEQEVFQALSVFRGGFDQEAAQHIADASMHDLRALVYKSFLHRLPTGRYDVHELLRQYAAEKLGQSPATGEVVHDRHCAYYAIALQQWAEDLKGPRQQTALAEMDVEIENARAAWDWAIELGQVEWFDHAVESLGLYYQWRVRYQEGATMCRRAIERLTPVVSGQSVPSGRESRVLARVLMWQGIFSERLEHRDLASQQLQESLTFLEAAKLAGEDTRPETADVLMRMGEMARRTNLERARQFYEQSLALYRAVGNRWGMANAFDELGMVAWLSGTHEKARLAYEESLAIRRALGDWTGIAYSLSGLGVIAAHIGQFEAGERLQRESLTILREIGSQFAITVGLQRLAVKLNYLGNFVESHSVQEESTAILEDLGNQRALAHAHVSLAWAKAYLGKYGDARAQAQIGIILAQPIDYLRGIGLAHKLLGMISLAEGAYGEARRQLQKSTTSFREIGQRDDLASSLAGLGCAFRGLGEFHQAREYLQQALCIADETKAFSASMHALLGTVLYLAEQSEKERAVELFTLASCYPSVANSHLSEDIAGRPIAAVAATLPSEVVVAAQERGRVRDLHTTVAELLVELER